MHTTTEAYQQILNPKLVPGFNEALLPALIILSGRNPGTKYYVEAFPWIKFLVIKAKQTKQHFSAQNLLPSQPQVEL